MSFIKYTIMLLVLLFSFNASASTSNKELTVIAKIAKLCKTFSSDYTYSLIYNDITPESVADKKAIIEYFDKKDLKISTVRLEDTLSLEKINSNIVILANGLNSADQLRISEILNNKSLITVSTDLECVENNNCLLGIEVAETIKIYFSIKIYEQTKLKFDPTFNFMVKQI